MDRLISLARTWPGVRFTPDEEELVRFYYHPKLLDVNFQPDVIPLINLYEHTPQELIDMYPVPPNTNQAYFFTERSKINATDHDYDRRAKGGMWEIGGEILDVFDQNDILMAVKRLRRFVITAPGNVKGTDWEMLEYSLDDKEHVAIPSHLKDSFALCHISKKQPKKKPSKWQGQPAVHPAVAAGVGHPASAAGAGQPAVHPAVAVGVGHPASAARAGQPAVHPAVAVGVGHPASAAGAGQPAVHPAVAVGVGHPASAAGAGQPAVGAVGMVQPAVAAGTGLPAGAAGVEQPAGAAVAWEPPVDLNENYWSGVSYPNEDGWLSPNINLGGNENEDKSPVSKRANTG